jgi:hypothetical protein
MFCSSSLNDHRLGDAGRGQAVLEGVGIAWGAAVSFFASHLQYPTVSGVLSSENQLDCIKLARIFRMELVHAMGQLRWD